ncbi:MAG: hypothetical protein WCW67_04640 [Candidatus Margulisiibacteriota bacterium]|jgi:hypothetical protein
MKRKKIFSWVVAILMLGLFCVPAEARLFSIVTNTVNLVPGTPANGGTALFSDSSTPFTETRALTTGKITPSGPFTVANDANAGSATLKLTASDASAPGGAKDRTISLSAGYTAMGEPVDIPVNTWLQTIIDTPPPPTGLAQQIGFTLAIKPIVTATLEIKAEAPFTGNYAPSYYGATGYHYQVTLAGNPVILTEGDLAGAPGKVTFQLNPEKLVAGQNYSLKAYAYNAQTTEKGGTFAARWSAEVLFSTVTAVGGGPITIIYNLNKPIGKTGVNTISIPFDFASGVTDGNALAITTVSSLIKGINTTYGADAVTVFGWYDETTQTHVGLTGIVYNAGNIDAATKFTGAANLAAITDASLVKGRSYQVTVNVDGTKQYNLTGTAK